MKLSNEPLITEEALRERIGALAEEISRDYANRKPVLLGVLKGAFHFVSDLARAMRCPVEIEFIRAASYAGTESTGQVRVELPISISLRGRDVILVEDILDTGRTASAIRAHLQSQGTASIALCTLLDKPSRRVVPVTAAYTGFSIDDHFVVGYGLDYNERYRELAAVYILQPEA